MLILQKGYFKKEDGELIQSIHRASNPNQVTPDDVFGLDENSLILDLDNESGIVIPEMPSFLSLKISSLIRAKFKFVAVRNGKYGAIIIESKDDKNPVGSAIPEFKGI